MYATSRKTGNAMTVAIVHPQRCRNGTFPCLTPHAALVPCAAVLMVNRRKYKR